MLRKLFSHSVIYGIGPQIPKFAGLLLLPIISQDLTAADFGLYGVIQAYAQAFLYLKTLGTDVVLSNSFFKHPKTYRLYWRHVNGLLHVWSFIIAVVLAGIIVLTMQDREHTLEIILLNCLPIILFSTTENLFFRYYQLRQKPIPISLRVIVTGLINVGVTYVTIHHLHMGYRGWFYASFVASLVGFVAMIYPVYIKVNFLPVLRLRWKYLRRTLRISLPVLPHYYGNYLLSTFDRVVMDVLKVPTAFIGQYNAANMFGNYVTILATSSRKAAGPMLQAFYTRKDWLKARRLVFYWQALFLLGTTLLAIWLKEIIPFFIRTKDIGEIHGMAVWVVMAVNYTPMYAGANSQLYFFERTNVLWKRAFIAFAINVALNLALIPTVGIYAAAVSTFVAYMALGYSSFFIKSYHEVKMMELKPLWWLTLTVGLTLITLIVVELPWLPKAAFTILLLTALMMFAFRIQRMRRDALLKKK